MGQGGTPAKWVSERGEWGDGCRQGGGGYECVVQWKGVSPATEKLFSPFGWENKESQANLRRLISWCLLICAKTYHKVLFWSDGT
jgi:hypothetical protein